MSEADLETRDETGAAETAAAAIADPEAPTTGPKKGAAPTKRLPTPRIAYNKQLDLLRAYAAASGQGAKAVDNDAVAALVQLSPSTVSLANPFFADVGFLHKSEGGYLPDRSVVGFHRVWEWDKDKAGAELASRLRDAWFGDVLLRRLSFSPISEGDALTLLATEAEAGTAYRSQVATLLDYLETGGLIVRENGEVRRGVTDTNAPSTIASPSADDRGTKAATGVVAPTGVSTIATGTVGPTGAGPRLPLLIQGLLEQLPTTGSWTRAEADKWLELARLTFEVVYKIEPDSKRVEPG